MRDNLELQSELIKTQTENLKAQRKIAELEDQLKSSGDGGGILVLMGGIVGFVIAAFGLFVMHAVAPNHETFCQWLK